ncbi:MAG: hypothetical protein ACP5SI_09395 [Chloroflexia bacterium]
MADSPYIRASEIQAYCYCARGWWLQYVRGFQIQDTTRLDAGREAHQRHARVLLSATRLHRLAWATLIAALLLLLVGALLLRKG